MDFSVSRHKLARLGVVSGTGFPVFGGLRGQAKK